MQSKQRDNDGTAVHAAPSNASAVVFLSRPRNPTDIKSMKRGKVVGGTILFAIGFVVVAIGLVPEMMCSVISAAGGQCRTLSYTTVSSFILGVGGLLAFGGAAVSISGLVRKRERAGPRGPT